MLKTFLRVFFSCILSLFLAILALGAGLCHYAKNTVCNPANLQRLGTESGFCQQLYDEIVYDWENYLAITGVETPEEIMVVLTQEQVTQDALKYINDSYSGSATLQTQTLRKNLEDKLREYAFSNNIYDTPEEELEQNIQDLVDACIADYESAISIPLLPKILGSFNRYTSIFSTCTVALTAGCAVLLLFLVFLQKKRQDVLYYAALSTGTGSILLLAIPKVAAHYNVVNRLPFTDSALKTLLRSYLQTIFDIAGKYGNFFLIAASSLLILYILCEIILGIAKRRKAKATGNMESVDDLAATASSDIETEENIDTEERTIEAVESCIEVTEASSNTTEHIVEETI